MHEAESSWERRAERARAARSAGLRPRLGRLAFGQDAGGILSRRRPASVRASWREVRWNSRAPIRVSSRPTAFETVPFERPRSAAAGTNEPVSATLAKMAQASKSGRLMDVDPETMSFHRFYFRTRRQASRLSQRSRRFDRRAGDRQEISTMSDIGLHHVTAFSGPAARNLDFYTRVLGLRLVKKTVNFDDPGTYHLYYGDEAGRPAPS